MNIQFKRYFDIASQPNGSGLDGERDEAGIIEDNKKFLPKRYYWMSWVTTNMDFVNGNNYLMNIFHSEATTVHPNSAITLYKMRAPHSRTELINWKEITKQEYDMFQK